MIMKITNILVILSVLASCGGEEDSQQALRDEVKRASSEEVKNLLNEVPRRETEPSTLSNTPPVPSIPVREPERPINNPPRQPERPVATPPAPVLNSPGSSVPARQPVPPARDPVVPPRPPVVTQDPISTRPSTTPTTTPPIDDTLSAKEKAKRTALELMRSFETSDDVTRLSQEARASAELKTHYDELLMAAVKKNRINATQRLLELRANPNTEAPGSFFKPEFPLIIAAHSKSAEIVNLLLKNGAEVDKKLNSGETTMVHLLKIGGGRTYIEMLNLLLDGGAKLSKSKDQPLFYFSLDDENIDEHRQRLFRRLLSTADLTKRNPYNTGFLSNLWGGTRHFWHDWAIEAFADTLSSQNESIRKSILNEKFGGKEFLCMLQERERPPRNAALEQKLRGIGAICSTEPVTRPSPAVRVPIQIAPECYPELATVFNETNTKTLEAWVAELNLKMNEPIKVNQRNLLVNAKRAALAKFPESGEKTKIERCAKSIFDQINAWR